LDGVNERRRWNMDRADLAALLDRPARPFAFAACRDAVLAGDEFQIWEHDVGVDGLVRIYRRRERDARRTGRPTLGFAEAVTDLEACRLPFVWLGRVAGQHPPYNFQLFLEPGETGIVACLAVAAVS
jgi:hypothetical protein